MTKLSDVTAAASSAEHSSRPDRAARRPSLARPSRAEPTEPVVLLIFQPTLDRQVRLTQQDVYNTTEAVLTRCNPVTGRPCPGTPFSPRWAQKTETGQQRIVVALRYAKAYPEEIAELVQVANAYDKARERGPGLG